MKNYLVTIFLLFTFSNSQAFDRAPLLIGAMEYAPHSSSKLVGGGANVEIVKAAYKLMGREVRVKFYPWNRLMEEINSGGIDGAVGLWYSSERAKKMLYSKGFYNNKIVFFYNKDHPITIAKSGTQKKYVIGGLRGGLMPEGLAAFTKRIEWVTSDTQNIEKLSLGRVDLIVVDLENTKNFLHTKPALKKRISPLDYELESRLQHHVISKKSKNSTKLLKDFNLALDQLRESGQIEKILEKYGIEY